VSVISFSSTYDHEHEAEEERKILEKLRDRV
jgi:hypothetical protein